MFIDSVEQCWDALINSVDCLNTSIVQWFLDYFSQPIVIDILSIVLRIVWKGPIKAMLQWSCQRSERRWNKTDCFFLPFPPVLWFVILALKFLFKIQQTTISVKYTVFNRSPLYAKYLNTKRKLHCLCCIRNHLF